MTACLVRVCSSRCEDGLEASCRYGVRSMLQSATPHHRAAMLRLRATFAVACVPVVMPVSWQLSEAKSTRTTVISPLSFLALQNQRQLCCLSNIASDTDIKPISIARRKLLVFECKEQAAIQLSSWCFNSQPSLHHFRIAGARTDMAPLLFAMR